MKLTLLRLVPALLLTILLAVACGTAKDGTMRTKTYRNDGYLGITNTNPNLQTGPSYHTYEVDTNMMREAVAPIAGVRKVRITTNGTNVSVKLTVPRGLAVSEKERIRNESLQALQHAVPRYDFKVSLQDK